MSVNSVGLLTVSGLYWFRSRNFLRMKNSLCFPEFCVLTSGKGGMKEESKLHSVACNLQTLPMSPKSQQNFASPSCPNWSSFSIHGIS